MSRLINQLSPNPRLQRTRFASLRSPLSRKPFGDEKGRRGSRRIKVSRLGLLVAATCILTLSGELLGQQAETYRGVPFGASEAKAKASIKFHACKATPASFGLTGRLAKRMCSSTFMVGSIKVSDSVFFRNDAMVNVFMSFRASDFDGVREVFVEKYGKPTTDSRDTVQNRLGAQYENETLTWSGPTVTITLSRFSGSLDSGSAMFAANAFTSEYIRAEAHEKRKAKEAF